MSGHYKFNSCKCVVATDRKQAERVAALMRAITGNNWQVSSLSSNLMTSDNSPIVKRFA